MLRSSTPAVLHNKRRTSHIILRSRRDVPQYGDCGRGSIDQGNDIDDGSRYGNFSVLNENTHPGVVYYFIEIRNPNDILNHNMNNNQNGGSSNDGNGGIGGHQGGQTNPPRY